MVPEYNHAANNNMCTYRRHTGTELPNVTSGSPSPLYNIESIDRSLSCCSYAFLTLQMGVESSHQITSTW